MLPQGFFFLPKNHQPMFPIFLLKLEHKFLYNAVIAVKFQMHRFLLAFTSAVITFQFTFKSKILLLVGFWRQGFSAWCWLY